LNESIFIIKTSLFDIPYQIELFFSNYSQN